MIINMNGAKAPETPSSVLQEKTVTPETLPTVIGPDEGYDGLTQVTVNPDSQLIPTNIRSGKTIFGVEGSFIGEPTAGVDLSMMGVGDSFTIPYTLAVGYPPIIDESPTRLTELGFTSVKQLSESTGTISTIQYGSGFLCANEGTTPPTAYTSSYVPSVTSNKWYYKSGTIPAGEMKFYLQYPYQSWVKNSTHIVGDGYLVPVLHIAYGSYFPCQPEISVSLMVDSASEIAQSIKINVDTELLASDIKDPYASKMFTLNVPEITFESYGYLSSSYNAKKVSLTYVFVPNKIVIS